MEVQSECSEPPPCDPQPSGKINKAAFKLFGKRKSAGGMPSIFSVRSKGEGAAKAGGKAAELVRSKTHDGLTAEAPAESARGGGKEESASSDQVHTAAAETGPAAAPARGITKSLSFFSLLRRGGSQARGGEGDGAAGRRGRGLKGLFSSMRWRRKERPGPREEGGEAREGDPLPAPRPDSVEVPDEDVTLTLEPQPHAAEERAERPTAGDTGHWREPSPPAEARGEEVEPLESPPAPPSERMAAEEPPAPSPLRAPTVEPPGRSSPGRPAAATPPPEHSAAEPPSEPSVERLCSMFTDVTSLKSFDSLTGCGDIIADAEEDSGNGGSGTSSGTGSSGGAGGPGRGPPAKAPVPTAPAPPFAPVPRRVHVAPKKPPGSGVVAYMGGGEEMASPDAVDDADMQGLWHMLPRQGEDSPGPPRAELPLRHAPVRPAPAKGLGLSKIPVSGGGGRAGKPAQARPSPPPADKEPQDAPPSDEGYWDSPTPGPEEEQGGFPRRDALPRDSCSGDALCDLYDADSPGAAASDDDDDDDTSSPSPSAGDLKLSPPSREASSSSSCSFRSMKGSASLPRDSKIPVTVRQTPPPHSSSQGALSSALSPTSRTPPAKADAMARTRIPVSKVPVRRAVGKPGNAARNRK